MRRKRKRERNGETKRDGNRERGQKTSSEPKREREGEERRKKENSKKSEVTPRGKLGSLPLLSLPVFFGHSGHRTLTYAHATLSHARIGTHVTCKLPSLSFTIFLFLSLSLLYSDNKYVRVEMHTCELNLCDDVGGYADARGRRRRRRRRSTIVLVVMVVMVVTVVVVIVEVTVCGSGGGVDGYHTVASTRKRQRHRRFKLPSTHATIRERW